MEKKALEELEFCIDLWNNQGYCEFGGHTNCYECAAPYLLLKLITGETLHGGNMTRLKLDDWKKKIYEIKNNL